jgi:hypothetical protein
MSIVLQRWVAVGRRSIGVFANLFSALTHPTTERPQDQLALRFPLPIVTPIDHQLTHPRPKRMRVNLQQSSGT